MALVIWTGAASSVYATAGNWAGGVAPASTNAVWLQGSVAITGADQSATAIDELLDELGANIGSSTTYLQVDPDSLEVNYSTGTHYLNIGSAALGPRIRNTSKPSSGYGMYLRGSGMTTLVQTGGSVGVAAQLDETSTLGTAKVSGSSILYLGPGVTFTTLILENGTVTQACAGTTVTVYGGTYVTEGVGAITTLNVFGGNVTLNSTGTITTLNHYGGFIDAVGDGSAKTITTYNAFTNGTPSMEVSPVVTISNYNKPTTPFKVTYERT